MATPVILMKTDPNGRITGEINSSDQQRRVLLAADTQVTIEVPSDAQLVIYSFAGGSGVWVLKDNSESTVLTLPTGTTDSNASEQNPAVRTVNDTLVTEYIHLISAQAASCGLSFYKRGIK